MKESDLVIFQEVHSMEEALDLEALLLNNGVHCKIIETESSFDPTSGKSEDEKLSVQVWRTDFEKAREVLLQSAHESDLNLDSDHYFNDFQDEELLDVLKNEDDWSPEDVTLARKLLAERNIEFNEEEILTANENKRNANDLPEKISSFYLILGFIIALLGGLLGIAFGLYVATLKKNDRYGNRIYYYDATSRKYASFIFIVGISILLYFTFYLYWI